MAPWQSGPLRVDGQHLKNGDHPFFFLADTAWLLMANLTMEETELYLQNRKELGFTVIQCVYGYTHPGEKASSLSEGRYRMDGAYDEKSRKTAEMASRMGLYLALLPAWGSLVKDGFLREDNVEGYLAHVVHVYEGLPNIIWVLGGDIEGEACRGIYRKAGQYLKARTPDRLITYHPFGRTSSSQWFHEEPWLDFNMFQSGHRRYDQRSLGAWDDHPIENEFFGEDNYRYARIDLLRLPPKPTLDGEPSYEAILQGLHDSTQPCWQAGDVRRYAWWAVLSGTCGHTYGHCAVQQMCLDPAKGKYGVKTTWKEALHAEGAGEMRILKELLERYDWQKARPEPERILSGSGEKYDYIPCLASEDFILAYCCSGKPFVLDASGLGTYRAYYVNPVTGARSLFAVHETAQALTCSPAPGTDCAVVLERSDFLEGTA